MKPTDYLKEPYRWVFLYDKHTHTWTGLLEEFPGCIDEGVSLEDAFIRLERAACAWIEAALAMGQTIPEPKFKGGDAP